MSFAIAKIINDIRIRKNRRNLFLILLDFFVVVALQDLTFFSSVNGVKTTNFINALEQGYKNHFGSDLPTIA